MLLVGNVRYALRLPTIYIADPVEFVIPATKAPCEGPTPYQVVRMLAKTVWKCMAYIP